MTKNTALDASADASKEIKCPHCGTVFTIDEAEYADIVRQVRTVEFENELHSRLAEAETAKQTEIALAEVKIAQQSQKVTAEKDVEIQRLKSELKAVSTDQELAVTKAVSAAEKKVSEAESRLQLQAAEQQLLNAALRESHSKELALKEELIERYKNMKAKLSVKLLGETLEQHCETEFDRMRSLAFPRAEFSKDNDASGGTKGDYVFRASASMGSSTSRSCLR